MTDRSRRRSPMSADYTRVDRSLSRAEGGSDPGHDRRNNDEEAHSLLLAAEPFDFDDGHDDDGDNDEEASPAVATPRRPLTTRLCRWLGGPAPPRRQTVKAAFLPSIQRFPVAVLDRSLPRTTRHRAAALAAFLLLWAVAFVPPLLLLAGGGSDGDGRGVVNLDCVDSFWRGRNGCGPDGVDCQPFSDVSFVFRCHPGCAGVRLLNPRAVGPLDVVYQPLVVGGGGTSGGGGTGTGSSEEPSSSS